MKSLKILLVPSLLSFLISGTSFANCESDIRKAYVELLGREVDPAGLHKWLDECTNQGRNIAWIRDQIKDSPEYKGEHKKAPEYKAGKEMDYETYKVLDNLPPPTVSRHFIMDGQIDPSAQLLKSNNGMNLYATFWNGELYVAASSPHLQTSDLFIFIASKPGELLSSPDSKGGSVSAWSVFLEHKSSNGSTQWHVASGEILKGFSAGTTGSVVEGVIDIELLLGYTPQNVYLAAGMYGPQNGGKLLGQVPAGNADPHIDPTELYNFECPKSGL